jgi:hypothetical protein
LGAEEGAKAARAKGFSAAAAGREKEEAAALEGLKDEESLGAGSDMYEDKDDEKEPPVDADRPVIEGRAGAVGAEVLLWL